MISNLWSDLRYGARAVSARPAFAAVVMLTLAFGIGVNVASFSLIEQVLLRTLPVAEPDRLVNLSAPGPKLADAAVVHTSVAGEADTVFTYPMFRDLERGQEPFTGIAAHRSFDASLSTGEGARLDTGMFVSGSYFSVLGLQPALGRLLGPQDDRVDGQAESVVLSHEYWQRTFDEDPTVVGRRLIVNAVPLTIVGVAPPGFHGTTVGARASIFVPITFRGGGISGAGSIPDHDSRNNYWVHLFARLAPGVTREEAASAINPLYRAILNEIEAPLASGADGQTREQFRTRSLVVEPGARGQSSLLVPLRDRLEMLFAVSGVVLLLCLANVAGLILIRGSARSGEMAIRASMGATPRRLASLLLAESLLLALPAAAASLPVALLTLRVVASIVPGVPAAAFDVSLSFAAALVAIGIALVSALAFGLFPVRGVMRTEPGKTLQAYGARQTSGKRVTRFRTALATAQIALSMALLAMTGVFVQSLANIARVDLGVDVDSVVTFSISPQASGYTPEASARFLDRLGEELAATPGVESAASAWIPLLSGGGFGLRGFAIEGVEVEDPVALNFVSPGLFQTLGIQLLAGRDFRDADAAGTPEVVVVNQRFVEGFRLAGDVVGRRIDVRGGNQEIVGLVADAKYGEVTAALEPQLFLPRNQSPPFATGSATFYIRTLGPPEAFMNAVRETVARVDPIVPITDLRTMEQQVRDNLAIERFVAGASTGFAVLATVLAGLGLYGVLAYSVAQRSREIGLRFALGAPAGRIRGMVLRQVAVIAGIGVVLGMASSWLLGRAARNVLFGVEAGDPIAFAVAAAVVAAVTLGAAYIPVRRASRVDPMTVLRYE